MKITTTITRPAVATGRMIGMTSACSVCTAEAGATTSTLTGLSLVVPCGEVGATAVALPISAFTADTRLMMRETTPFPELASRNPSSLVTILA